jgi:hypothetical protein
MDKVKKLRREGGGKAARSGLRSQIVEKVKKLRREEGGEAAWSGLRSQIVD